MRGRLAQVQHLDTIRLSYVHTRFFSASAMRATTGCHSLAQVW
jgi:hypothetical protein